MVSNNHARILTSVPRHPKFLRAGPAASWLWLCGVCYCQDALTDGFISVEAVHTLGVPKPLPLAAVLVRERLWQPDEHGWRIHDYLEHNNSADYIQRVRQERKAAGQKGGRTRLQAFKQVAKQVANHLASGLLKQTAKQTGEQTAKQTVNPTFYGTTDTGTTKNEELRTPDGAAASALWKLRAMVVGARRPLVPVITAVVTKDILPLRLAEHRLVDATRQRCQELHIDADDVAICRAVDSALFRYYRESRLMAGLPPDPRGIYRDHILPRRLEAHA